jgi:hypothetical protein
MKTQTLLFVSIAIFFAVSVSNSFARPVKSSTNVNMSVEAEEALDIEEWMVDESFWGIEKEASIDVGETSEGSMEIESWMYDNEYWGMS